MGDTAMTRYLEQLERRGQRDIAEHLAVLRIGLPAALSVLSCIAYYTIGNVGESYAPVWWGSVLASLAGAAAGVAAGGWFARRSADRVDRLRVAIRSRLLDGGLLQLALEPNPYDRLPSLQPVGPLLLGRRQQAASSEPLAARLERFINTYNDCSLEAGLVPGATPPPEQPGQPALLPGPLRRLIYVGGFALVIAGVLLRQTMSSSGNHLLWYALTFGVSLAGYGLISRGWGMQSGPQADPFGQSSLETAALRLELADLLSRRQLG